MNKREKKQAAIGIILIEITIVLVYLLFLVPAYGHIINADYTVNGGVLGGGTGYDKEVTLIYDYDGHPAGTVFTAYTISFDGYIISSNLESSSVETKFIPFDQVAEKDDLIATANDMLNKMDEYISARKTYMLYLTIGFAALALTAPFISVCIRKKKLLKQQQNND